MRQLDGVGGGIGAGGGGRCVGGDLVIFEWGMTRALEKVRYSGLMVYICVVRG